MSPATNTAGHNPETSTNNVAEHVADVSTTKTTERTAEAIPTPKAAEHATAVSTTNMARHDAKPSTANLAEHTTKPSISQPFQFLCVRLIPIKPTNQKTFGEVLKKLTIVAYDLAVEESIKGVEIGRAADSLLLPTTVNVEQTNEQFVDDVVFAGCYENGTLHPAIRQDWKFLQDPQPIFEGVRRDIQTEPLSVATAIIPVKTPPTRSTVNLRCEFKLHDELIGTTIDYNVDVNVISWTPDATAIPKCSITLPDTLFNLPPSTYFALPIQEPSHGALQLSSDGTPPDFNQLCAAINTALDHDSSKDAEFREHVETRTQPFTAAESMQIASAIVWNRALYPPPDEPGNLSDMYTIFPKGQGPDAKAATQIENERQQFEGNLQSYHSTRGADAAKLANFVFAASAAIYCEHQSAIAPLAGLAFPVLVGHDDPANITYSQASVVLSYENDKQRPRFTVPAAYFYVLGASYPNQVSAPQRYKAALMATEDQLHDNFQKNVDSGNLKKSVAPAMTEDGDTTINLSQAARRLVALGSTTGPVVDVSFISESPPTTSPNPSSGTDSTPASALVNDWLDCSDQTADFDVKFWKSATKAYPISYLNLLLQAIAEGDTKLVTKIETQLAITSADQLKKFTASDWTTFFFNPASNLQLLPTFTQPGSSEQRVNAFIQRVRKFLDVGGFTKYGPPEGQITGIDLPVGDVLQRFIAAYNTEASGNFGFSSGFVPDARAVDQAVAIVYPGDEEAQAWLKDAVAVISYLSQITYSKPPANTKTLECTMELQFALMEALYSRGLTHPYRICGLTFDQFRRALFGTVAYTEANAKLIWKLATGSDANDHPTTEQQRESDFVPINPDGSLTNCLPPPNLSPFGATAYLHEILAIPLGGNTLGNLVAGRRGPLQDLCPSMANLSATLPCIDLVNESLEALGNHPSTPHGIVFDTSDQSFIISPASDVRGSALLNAVPEHSSPSNTAKSAVYDSLKTCFTSPHLPYAQGIDICSSNLDVLGTNRFETMRYFRRDITELAIDANCEPDGFQRHLWRYPVRFDIGLQYLNISDEEYKSLFSGTKTDKNFLESVLGLTGEVLQPAFFTVVKFLKLTCLTYREFLHLWRCGYVPFDRAAVGIEGQAVDGFPDGNMCDLGSIRISFKGPEDALPLTLRKVLVFIRLWRCLHQSNACRTGFDELAKICTGLQLFKDDCINPDFIRQLASFMMLQNHFIPLSGKHSAKGRHEISPLRKIGLLLAIWSAAGRTSGEWDQAVEHLLDRIQEYAKAQYDCQSRGLGFMKDLKDNLRQLALLAGFSDVDPWFAKPTSTIRFAEVLAKIYASDFTVGEIIFLFTAGDHLAGDDPFPLPDALKSAVTPLSYPEENHSIWELRNKLINATIEGDDQSSWSWREIESALREMGYDPDAQDNALKYFGEHFFHVALEACGYATTPRARRFEVDLPAADTTATLWNEERGPFRYDADGAGRLWLELPMCDEAVIEKLKGTRQLSEKEIEAVQALYFAPRAALAPFALMFENFPAAVDKLIHEPSDEERFSFFRQQFALFYRRCQIIAEHMGEHIPATKTNKNFEGQKLAWHVLACVSADENSPIGRSWESDSGTPPQIYTWDKRLSGSSFAALLGLTGTGLLGQYEVQTKNGDAKVWREITGDLTFFGNDQNKENVPIPTILPALDFEALPNSRPANRVVNGFAVRDRDEQLLGGAQPFRVCWSGALLIDTAGEYSFCVGQPRPGNDTPGSDDVKHQRWLVTLGWGQKSWTMINHCWDAPEAPSASSDPLWLHRGVYHIEISFEQQQPLAGGHRRQPTGFQVKYKGPDTENYLCVVPSTKLFCESKRDTLSHGLNLQSSALQFLNSRYSSSLRDIRRTYQRVYKGILFASRYGLSVQPLHQDRRGVSELGYMLRHPQSFVGTSYYRPVHSEIRAKTHQAFFDFNFLPVADLYAATIISDDDRGQPSAQRQAALFDWWERMYDYSHLQRWVRDARSRSCWVLFYEATEQATRADELMRYLGISTNLVSLVLNYFGASNTSYSISTQDLTDERWALRVWRAGVWLEQLKKRFLAQHLDQALPWLWSSDDPNLVIGGASGNGNLTAIVQNGLLNRSAPAIEDLAALNNGLRLRARKALLSYLCGNNRVPLPFKADTFATMPRDLSDLLLCDVEVGIGEKATRIDDAISSVQTFVHRIRLGLELGIHATSKFIGSWDTKYSTLKAWKTSKRRELYPENWINWDELHNARKLEGFVSLEKQLQRGVLTIAKPSASMSWASMQLPKDRHLANLQSLDLFSISLIDSTAPQAKSTASQVKHDPVKTKSTAPEPTADVSWLTALPEHDGQLSSIAPLLQVNDSTQSNADGSGAAEGHIPLWINAAVKMGANFVRVAAASSPVATIRPGIPAGPCRVCHDVHAPQVDEYYFWLLRSKYFDDNDAQQDLDLGSTSPDPSCDWDPGRDNPDKKKLKDLLRWDSQAIFYLNWCRVHSGKFDAPRQSDKGVIKFTGKGTPGLECVGRRADSLLFSVNGVNAFRYDMSTDWAQVVVHDLTDVNASDDWNAAMGLIDINHYLGLTAYPSFVFFEPGKPVIPPSNFSIALSIASTLRSHGHFEASLKWYELAFDSRRGPTSRDNSWKQSDTPAVNHQQNQPTSPNDTRAAVAKESAVLLDYLEALLQWGEDLLCKGSTESNGQALVIFNMISKIAGTCPAPVLLEDTVSNSMTISTFTPVTLPLNPRLMGLYDGVANGLAKLHQIDTGLVEKNKVIHKRRDGYPLLHSPHRKPPYRFSYLLAKASDLAGLVRSLGDSLLSATEKGDSEYLAALQAMHSRQVTSLSLENAQHAFRAADWDVQGLEQSLNRSMRELSYNQTLIRNGYNSNENAFINSTKVAMIARGGGETCFLAAEAASDIPDFYVGGAGAFGSPLSFSKVGGGSSIASNFHFAGEILNSTSEIANTSANMALNQAGWDRRSDEWYHQVDVITIELEELECQKLAADRRRHIALHELNNTQRQIEHAIEVQDFMRDKTTNFDLYLFLQRETAIRYRQIYDMALHAAREAQEMFCYERRDTMHDFLAECTWSTLHDGLAAGDKLSLALQAMDRAYTETNVREYELTKFISLNMHLPLAFLALKATGSCEFTIPEWFFDLDYPGHYMRRIKSISLTIPCVVGPYTGIHARLELLHSRIRVSPLLADLDTASDCSPAPRDLAESYDCRSLTEDERFAHLYGAREAIATSSGLSDSGLFELSLGDERYLPFEYAGAVSKWCLKLPPENNAFELDTVTDVVIQVKYTAREGGDVLRRAAGESARGKLPADGWRLFDVRRELTDAWALLERDLQKSGNGHARKEVEERKPHRKPTRPELRLILNRNMFPFLTGRRSVSVVRLQLFIQLEEDVQHAGSHIKVKYCPVGHQYQEEEEEEEEGEDEFHYGSRTHAFDCVSHAKWPAMYHGVIDVEIEVPPALRGGNKDVGTFRFPKGLGKLREVYILCRYEARDRGLIRAQEITPHGSWGINGYA